MVIPFIGLDDLIATKRTGRLQDAADIEVPEEIKRELARQGECGGSLDEGRFRPHL